MGTSSFGRTIKLFLADGDANGVLTAEIMNWTGKFICVPRSELSKLASRSDAKRAGVYFLIGDDPDSINSDRVYVGESDDVYSRLTRHEQENEKDFWSLTVLVTSKDENLTKSHTLYLESRLIAMVRGAGRAKLDNATNPTKKLPESDAADMEDFLSQVKMVLPVLGHQFLQPKPLIKPASVGISDETSPEFQLISGNTKATAQEINGDFIVQAGSMARRADADSLSKGYRAKRQYLINEGILTDGPDSEHYEFVEDYQFNSPSAAAVAVLGSHVNGRLMWKNSSTSTTYADWQEDRLLEAESEAVDETDIEEESDSDRAPYPTDEEILQMLGGGTVHFQRHRTKCYKTSNDEVIHIKKSGFHTNTRLFWFGIASKTHDIVQKAGCTHYLFVLANEGFVKMPIEVVNEHLSSANRTLNSDNTVRHYHFYFSHPPEVVLKGGKDGQSTDMRAYFDSTGGVCAHAGNL